MFDILLKTHHLDFSYYFTSYYKYLPSESDRETVMIGIIKTN